MIAAHQSLAGLAAAGDAEALAPVIAGEKILTFAHEVALDADALDGLHVLEEVVRPVSVAEDRPAFGVAAVLPPNLSAHSFAFAPVRL